MGIFLFITLFCVLGWIAFCTIHAFRRHHLGKAWWIFLYLFLLAGFATGVWAGFMLVYSVSPTLRFAGFPFPMAIFHLESGDWVDYVHEPFIMILIGVADVVLVVLSSVLPVSVVYYAHRFCIGKNWLRAPSLKSPEPMAAWLVVSAAFALL